MKHFVAILFLVVILCTSLYAQTPVNVISDATNDTEGNLNNAIQNAINEGTLSNMVFNLEPGGYYILTGPITIPEGQYLEIVAPMPGTTQQEASPQIVWTSSDQVTKDYIIDCYGDLTMKNIWIRFADVSGAQVGGCIQFEDNSEANVSGKGEVGIFENCIFDYAPACGDGGSITVVCQHFKGTFRNCYFRNCIDTHLKYYGRAVSFPYKTTKWHTDEVLFENCTFANIGYVYMQEENEYGDNVHFNHCTFLNVMMHCLESGVWYKMSVTNSIFVNPWMLGYIPAEEEKPDGILDIQPVDSMTFTPPFTDADRGILIANNSFFYEEWLLDWMGRDWTSKETQSPYSKEKYRNREEDKIPKPRMIFDKETIALFDSVDGSGNKVFPKLLRENILENADPEFKVPPTNIDGCKDFLNRKWDDNTDANWAWNPESGHKMEWPLTEDISYSNQTIKTAGMNGYPLGDLWRWGSTEIYNAWKAQSEAEMDYIRNKVGFISVSKHSIDIPVAKDFTLSLPYPNPFNPVSKIQYSVPRTSYVTLKVYNVAGQEVRTLHAGVQKAGNYIATFDGSDLPSGIYIYQLQSGNISISKKITLMK